MTISGLVGRAAKCGFPSEKFPQTELARQSGKLRSEILVSIDSPPCRQGPRPTIPYVHAWIWGYAATCDVRWYETISVPGSTPEHKHKRKPGGERNWPTASGGECLVVEFSLLLLLSWSWNLTEKGRARNRELLTVLPRFESGLCVTLRHRHKIKAQEVSESWKTRTDEWLLFLRVEVICRFCEALKQWLNLVCQWFSCCLLEEVEISPFLSAFQGWNVRKEKC